MVGVDQEGGAVQRFKKGFSVLPPLAFIGEQYDKSPAIGKRLARDHAWLMASELLDVGVDFSFAPVVDIKDNRSNVIGDRSFHSVPEIVSILASIYVETLNSCGMSAVAKHFPGHGLVVEDSHVDLPVDKRPLTEIMNNDILPYQKCIKIGLEGIMMAHVLYSKVDEKAAGYSRLWINNILRRKIGFKGVIFSDDLNMIGAAIDDSYVERASMALAAGCDSLLLCNNRPAVAEILDSDLFETKDDIRNDRLEKMRRKLLFKNTLPLSQDPKWISARDNMKAIK